jgi:hypothetical protein
LSQKPKIDASTIRYPVCGGANTGDTLDVAETADIYCFSVCVEGCDV